MERVTALVERDLGKLDVAEHLVTSLVRRWNDSSEHRRSVLADIVSLSCTCASASHAGRHSPTNRYLMGRQ
ncbi:MAG: hypothetical protein M3Q75_06295 [Gemmatimonadota bacterium]|nr:hypothetical protein [Gemmatimonadota bacterium]